MLCHCLLGPGGGVIHTVTGTVDNAVWDKFVPIRQRPVITCSFRNFCPCAFLLKSYFALQL